MPSATRASSRTERRWKKALEEEMEKMNKEADTAPEITARHLYTRRRRPLSGL